MLNPKEKAVWELVKKNKVYKSYFFKKVIKLKWFHLLKKDGYFEPQNALGLEPADKKGYFTVPLWNVLPYLERVSGQAFAKKNEKLFDELLTIIKNVSYYSNTREGKNIKDNYRTWWYFIKILLNIPNDKIPEEIIKLIPDWLNTRFDSDLQGADLVNKLLPKFLYDKESSFSLSKAEMIIDIVTDIRWVKTKSGNFDGKEKAEAVVGNYFLFDGFIKDGLAKKVGVVCSSELIFKLLDKIQSVFKKEFKGTLDYSYIWFESLLNGPNSNLSDTKETLVFIIKEILLAKAKVDKKLTRRILNKLLSNEYKYPLFKRLALCVISDNWLDYKKIFWDLVKEIGDELFDNLYFEPEIYILLNKNIDQFNHKEEAILKVIIEKGPQVYLPKDNKERYRAYWKQKWYSAVKTKRKFNDLYEKNRKISRVVEEIEFKRRKVRSGPGPSPKSKDEILQMSNKQLAKFLTEFKTKDFWKGPTVEALGDTLKAAAYDSPDKFVKDLSPFLNTDYLYIYDLLWGINDRWSKGKLIKDRSDLFIFFERYINRKLFWKDKLKKIKSHWSANHLWVIGVIAELLKEAISDKETVISDNDLAIAKNLLTLILENLKQKKDEKPRDAVGLTLNSAYGKTITALIYLAREEFLRKEKKVEKSKAKLDADVKRLFEKLFDDGVVEAYVLFGEYLRWFYYFDSKWTENKVRVFISIDKYFWQSFLDGYVIPAEVNQTLYDLMTKHYERAIGNKFEDERTQERLIDHVAIGYLRGAKNKLFNKVLAKWDLEQIKEVISFFVADRKVISENSLFRQKVIIFWKRLYKKYEKRKKLSESEKKLISDSSRFIALFGKINYELFQLLKFTTPYVGTTFNSAEFIEGLDKLKNKGSKKTVGKYIARLFIEMLKGDSKIPAYDKVNIRSIIEFLFGIDDLKVKELAREICNIYTENGNDELVRDIYKANIK